MNRPSANVKELTGAGETHGLEGNAMTSDSKAEGTPDVPAQVFEQFLKDLTVAGVASELAARLHKTLLEEHIFTENALRAALFGEERLP